MKRKLALLLALVMLCATMLTACGSSGSKVVGTWEMTSAMAAGIETIDTMKESGYDMSFVFDKNGKVKVISGGEEQGEADWKEDGDKVTISESGSEMEFTLADGKLTTEQSGATLVFEKK